MSSYNRGPQMVHRYFEEELDEAKVTRWLSGQRINRRLKEPRIKQLMDDMLNGRWVDFTGTNTLSFSKDGVLLDGQHRLEAFLRVCKIKPGFTIRAGIFRDVSEDAQIWMDGAMVRGMSAVIDLDRDGDHPVENSTKVSSVLRLLTLLQPGGVLARDIVRRKISNLETRELKRKYPGTEQSVIMGKKIRGADKLISDVNAGFLHYLFNMACPDKANAFWHEFMVGGPIDGRPIPILRLQLHELGKEESKPSYRYVISICILAWNDYLDDKKRTEFYKWNEAVESIPRIKGLAVEEKDSDS